MAGSKEALDNSSQKTQNQVMRILRQAAVFSEPTKDKPYDTQKKNAKWYYIVIEFAVVGRL
jgi:hypothetical protein